MCQEKISRAQSGETIVRKIWESKVQLSVRQLEVSAHASFKRRRCFLLSIWVNGALKNTRCMKKIEILDESVYCSEKQYYRKCKNRQVSPKVAMI